MYRYSRQIMFLLFGCKAVKVTNPEIVVAKSTAIRTESLVLTEQSQASFQENAEQPGVAAQRSIQAPRFGIFWLVSMVLPGISFPQRSV